LLNPNETEALIVQVNVQNGQHLQPGEVICTLETTKSVADLEAPQAGYILGLSYQAGQTVRSGEIFCYISEVPDWLPPPVEQESYSAGAPMSEAQAYPAGLRITQPALKLARDLGLDLDSLPLDRLVTESLVRSLAENQFHSGEKIVPDSGIDPSAIIVYGAGGHGKSIIEMIRALGSYQIMGVVDDDPEVSGQVSEIQVLGGAEVLPGLWNKGIRMAANAVGGIGNIDIRASVFDKLSRAGFTCPALLHPRAVIEVSAQLAPGVQIMPLAYVGSEAKVGFGCIINTGAIVSHDCIIGENSNIAPGVILAGEVNVGKGVLIGMGVTVNLRVSIGAHARLGNGCTIKADVPQRGIVRAGTIWPS
jgi:sugar O-acyltransferase (sialic acid O-acetyltransferase NeuD family)